MNYIKWSYSMFLSVFVCFFVICFFIFPNEVINASKEGIILWFNSIFPSVFTFIVGANLLIGLGFVDFIGTLLEPVMRPIFNVPGVGAFVAVMGIASGYPVGARLTVELRQKNLLTKSEAERLVSFSNNSGPLFLLGALGIGMFGSAEIGFFILIIHYLSAFATGLLFNFYKPDSCVRKTEEKRNNLLKTAFHNQRIARKEDGRKFGVLLGDSIRGAIDVLIQVGGFIVLFSVIVAVLKSTSIFDVAVNFLNPFVDFFGFNTELSAGVFVGLFEMTNGAYLLSNSAAPLIERVCLAGFIIAFSGLSIHAQSIAIISKSDINVLVYILGKIIHSIIALGFSLLLFPIVERHFNNAVFVSSGLEFSPFFSLFPSILCLIIAIIALLTVICFRHFQKDKTSTNG